MTVVEAPTILIMIHSRGYYLILAKKYYVLKRQCEPCLKCILLMQPSLG